MGIDARIVDGLGTKRKAALERDGGLVVTQNSYPALSYKDDVIIFREFLTDSSGSNDMTVNGSSTSQVFSVDADPKDDIYIKKVSFLISDAGAALNEFGNLSALSTGCDFFYENAEGTITIADQLQTNFSFIRLCAAEPAFGDAATAFRANNISGSSEGYLPVFDFATFGLPYGVRLRAGTTQRICIEINDNVSALDQFDAIAYGFKRLSNGD